MKSGILVAGSLNMDFVLRVEHLPAPGETVRGSDFQMTPGGKGANQAAAAGRLGGHVSMLGRVGDDIFAEQLRQSLSACDCDFSRVLETPGVSTGVAFIFVEPGGSNQIAVAAGANARLTSDDIRQAEDAFSEAGFLLLQLESQLATVETALELARKHGVITILDPAPARPLPPELLALVDICTPNETEIEALADSGPPSTMALQLTGKGPSTVILTLGAAGALVANQGQTTRYPAPKVEAIDTVAAGDCFNGALAVALAEGAGIPEAVMFANRAAAICVTRPGAQVSLPTRQEVSALA